jgi:hypothetical protein
MESTRYFVEFDINTPFTKEMAMYIPSQRKRVSTLFYEGKILSYSISAERDKLWVVFVASSEEELVSLIESLPMIIFMTYRYRALMFVQMASVIPEMSLN